MRALPLALIVLAALLSFMAGWLNPGRVEEQVVATRHPRAAMLQPVRYPNLETAAAVNVLKRYMMGREPPAPTSSGGDPDNPAPPKPAKPVRAAPPPPPPPPDVAAIFRNQLAAVVQRGGAPAALLVDSSGETRSSRLLKIGDVFMDRWRLTGLTTNEAVLNDGKQERRVPLFGAAGAG